MSPEAENHTKVKPLPPKRAEFVRQYLVDLNGTQAAIRAGYSPKSAKQQADQLLSILDVQRAVKAAMDERAARTEITADAVLRKWWDIANANANEVIQHRRGACRYCYGEDHLFQWRSQREYDEAVEEATRTSQPLPVCDGGFDYDPMLAPHAKCPECAGHGESRVYALDTANLSGPALLLYAGVKATRDGLEIKLRDQDKALENVARHLGMFNDKLTLKGEAENPLTLLIKQIQGSSLPVVANPPDDEDDE